MSSQVLDERHLLFIHWILRLLKHKKQFTPNVFCDMHICKERKLSFNHLLGQPPTNPPNTCSQPWKPHFFDTSLTTFSSILKAAEKQ